MTIKPLDDVIKADLANNLSRFRDFGYIRDFGFSSALLLTATSVAVIALAIFSAGLSCFAIAPLFALKSSIIPASALLAAGILTAGITIITHRLLSFHVREQPIILKSMNNWESPELTSCPQILLEVVKLVLLDLPRGVRILINGVPLSYARIEMKDKIYSSIITYGKSRYEYTSKNALDQSDLESAAVMLYYIYLSSVRESFPNKPREELNQITYSLLHDSCQRGSQDICKMTTPFLGKFGDLECYAQGFHSIEIEENKKPASQLMLCNFNFSKGKIQTELTCYSHFKDVKKSTEVCKNISVGPAIEWKLTTEYTGKSLDEFNHVQLTYDFSQEKIYQYPSQNSLPSSPNTPK